MRCLTTVKGNPKVGCLRNEGEDDRMMRRKMMRKMMMAFSGRSGGGDLLIYNNIFLSCTELKVVLI